MRILPIVLASVLLTGAVACSGDDAGTAPQASGTPTTTAPTTPAGTTKADYVAAVNKVCADVEKESEALPEPKKPEDYTTFVTKIADIFEDAQKRLRAIEQPAADAAEIEEKFLAVNDKQAKILREAIPKVEAAAKKGEQQAQLAFVEAVTELGQLSEEQDKFTKAYGLTACGS